MALRATQLDLLSRIADRPGTDYLQLADELGISLRAILGRIDNLIDRPNELPPLIETSETFRVPELAFNRGWVHRFVLTSAGWAALGRDPEAEAEAERAIRTALATRAHHARSRRLARRVGEGEPLLAAVFEMAR